MSDTAPLLEYLDLLQAHDWSFEFSDDHEVWKRGHAQRAEIHRRQPEVDPKWLIHDEVAPPYFRRNRNA